MQAEDILTKQKRQPFEPFRMFLSNGEQFDCRHPEMLLVGKRALTLGVARQQNDVRYDYAVEIDLLHVVRLEPIQSTAAGGNGEG